MSTLSLQDIQHLSHLARLNLTSEEQERFSQQLSSVVDYVDQLTLVDTHMVTEVRGVTNLLNVLAADVERAPDDGAHVDREQLMAAAPLQRDHFFQVRAVLEEI